MPSHADPDGSTLAMESPEVGPAVLFDLDGTLVDSVYYHVIAWHRALARAGIQDDHDRGYAALVGQVRPLPGARELLATLTQLSVPWAIATSGRRATATATLGALEIPPGVPVVTRDDVTRAKPDPDLFLAAAGRLGVPVERCVVVGDSVWDLLAAQRARALGVGILAGGYGQDELERAGAYRVYDDPRDLLHHLDELGIRVGEGDG